MTLADTIAPTSTAVSVNAEERAARLFETGTAWNTRIATRPKNAQLAYKVTGEGEGAVASVIRAGKHHFLTDVLGALAGDYPGASPVEFDLGALISCQIVVYPL